MNAQNVPCGAQRDGVNFPAAETPRTLWIELTSKCPYDCVFCSRKLRRGAGVHLPFPVYRELVESLAAPRRLVLNYSGESLCYPDLVPAIEFGRSRGAFVELVSAFSSIAPEMVTPLAHSGLGRLTVSVHAASDAEYRHIYRHASFTQLEARLTEFLAASAAAAHPPAVDLAFVAMDRNLGQLASVAAFAERIGVGDLTIWPVLRRDDIPERFSSELEAGGEARGEFLERVAAAVAEVERAGGGVKLLFSRPVKAGVIGEAPLPFPAALPEGARIHGCEQNPWETAHVLSNGDVVVCEALDKIPMGNLLEQPMAEIWRGEAYREFRRGYPRGEAPACRACPWKRAYVPGPPRSEILARDGSSAQLLYGWHENRGEDVVWSTQQAAAVLRRAPGSRTIHVSGILPPGPAGDANELAISCNGTGIGSVRNPWEELMPFGLDFPAPAAAGQQLNIAFRARHMLRPRERGMGTDDRDLGFALVLLASQRSVDAALAERQALRACTAAAACGARGPRRRCAAPPPAHALRAAPRAFGPPGDLRGDSRTGQSRRAGRVPGKRGMRGRAPRRTRADDRGRERHAAPRRTTPCAAASPASGSSTRGRWASPGPFAAASAPRASTGSTCLTTMRGSIPARSRPCSRCARPASSPPARRSSSRTPRVSAKKPIAPRSRSRTASPPFTTSSPAPGISDMLLYRRRRVAVPAPRCWSGWPRHPDAYNPFYWEDVEWGWRARKMGYRVLFCAESVVHHRHRATIGKHYQPDEIEATVERNRLLFQLRNLTAAGSLDRLFEEIARLPRPAMRHFLERSVIASCLRVRLWNHLAAREDGDIQP